MVEMAIVVPVLILLVFGLLEFGLAFKDRLTMAHAVSQATFPGWATRTCNRWPRSMADTGAGRLAAMFAAGRAEGRAGLLPFMTAGTPTRNRR